MPNIKLVNIRFRLDGDERDREIHDALFQYPDGSRNQVMKDALYAHLIGEGAGSRNQVGQALGSQANKLTRRAPVAGKVRPARQEQDTSNQCHPIQLKEPAATAEQPSEAGTKIPAAEKQSSGSGEDQQVIAGLRSMIL